LCIIIATEADNIPKTSFTPNGQELHSHHSTGRQWTYQTIYKTHCTHTCARARAHARTHAHTHTQTNKQFPT